jgi:hypothetical protein
LPTAATLTAADLIAVRRFLDAKRIAQLYSNIMYLYLQDYFHVIAPMLYTVQKTTVDQL